MAQTHWKLYHTVDIKSRLIPASKLMEVTIHINNMNETALVRNVLLILFFLKMSAPARATEEIISGRKKLVREEDRYSGLLMMFMISARVSLYLNGNNEVRIRSVHMFRTENARGKTITQLRNALMNFSKCDAGIIW